ncbi:hypothetical protein Tco_0194886 [Tanacetum coccineum]
MSNTNTNLQTQTSNALHNAIMEAGGKDRPPMLAPGNYVQWKSRIKRYIDTKPNNELIHYCLQNPPYKFKWTEKTVPVAEGSSETTTEGYMENYKNVSQDIRDQLNAEAEAVQIILTGIDNDIYSTVDACPNACEMWKAIERLKQGESINVQDLETNLYWEFGKFTSRDGESLESYYSRFYKMMNELVRNQCDVTNHQVNVQFLLQLQPEWQRFVTLVKQSQELKTVSYHKLYDILKQHQNEVNEIRAERLARTANPLALVAQQQPVYHPQNHPTQNNQYSSNRSQQPTRNRGKAIVNSSAPIYDQEPVTVTEDDEMSKEKEIDKLMALISLSFKKIYKPTNNNLRTSSNTSRANQDNSPRINRGTGYDNHRVVNVDGARDNVAYHKEKMLLCKQEEAGVQLNAEQADWKDDTDDESDDQEFEGHYMYMAQIQEVTPDPVDNSGPIFDAEPLHKVQNNNDNLNSPVSLSRFLQELLESMRITSIECRCYTVIHLPSHQKILIQSSSLFPHPLLALRIVTLIGGIDIFSGPDDSIPPGVESDFDSEEDIIDNLLNNDSTHERLTFNIEPDAPVINNVDELNEDECFDPGGGEINDEVDNSFTFVTWIFLPYLTYPEFSPLLSSTKNEDTIPRHLYLEMVASHQDGTFMCFNDRPKFSEDSRVRCFVPVHSSFHFKFSNNKTSVTACNDSLNAKTSNVNFVCVTCGKCVLNDNHDLCVLHYINGVNSRTRQPIAVPISTREPKHNVNQSVATSSKKTVATDSTVKKSRNITRKLYEQVSKTCSWWYPKYTPPGYNWKPKSQIGNVNPKVSMHLRNASRTANILEPMTPRCSTISNTPLSSNSFAARRDNSIHRRLWVLKAHDRKSQTSN